MSEESQRIFLSERFKQVNTGLPMAMPNTKFARPKDAPYGEFHVLGGDSFYVGWEGEQAGVPQVRVRYVHMVQMTVWIPDEKGVGPATRAADEFKKRFANRDGRDEAGSFYRMKGLQTISPTRTQQGWLACVYRIPFTRDQIEDAPPGLTL